MINLKIIFEKIYKIIINTIGTIDDLIENISLQISKTKSLLSQKYKDFPFDGQVTKLGDIFEIKIGRTPPTKEREWFTTDKNEIKWLSIKDMDDRGDYIFSTSQYLTKTAVEKFNIPLVSKGDILLSFKLTLGRTGIASLDMVTNEAIACFKVNDFYRPYLYCFLSNYDFNSNMESTSSIGKAFNSSLLKAMNFLLPSHDNIIAFNELAEPLLKYLLELRKKQNILINIKNDLLRKYF